MSEGWVKAHREMLEHAVMQDDWLCRLWMWCLLKARPASSQFKSEKLLAGQFVTGRSSASEQLNVSPSKWYRGMQTLEKLGCITATANSNWTTVTICNWATYQARKEVERTTNEQPVNNQRTTDEQPADTSKELKNLITKELKKEIPNTSPSGGMFDETEVEQGSQPKKPRKQIDYEPAFEEFWSSYPTRPGQPLRGKPATYKRWKSFALEEHPEILQAVKNYARRCGDYARDPERFFKEDFWRSYLTIPDFSVATTNGNRPSRNGTGQLYRPP